MNIEKRFPKKRVVITGAGSGLGRALALEFAKKTWNIAVADINGERSRETVAMIDKEGGAGLAIRCDVTDPDDFIKAVALLNKEWNGVDILVNNAGVAAAGYFEKIPLETWEWILDINLKSIIYGCRAFIPLFKEQGRGHIVNVASNAGIACLPEMGCYNVTKAAVISASETIRTELAPFDIGVTVVCPTFFKTNLMDQFSSPDERQRMLAEKFFERSKTSAETVARHVIKCMEKNRFRVITQADGRFVWWAKRHFPEAYFKIASYIYRKGILDKYLGLDQN
ncbi:MAG: short-chain dehydrogenase [Spirochaetes bacterium RBG_16_49_21]|nr:MAG: short-chain dehydrogenase [Spirochaetes bacterium RBG_16_49_21]